MDIARLGMQIDTRDVRRATTDLRTFDGAAGSVEKGTSRMAAVVGRAAVAFGGFLASGAALKSFIRQADQYTAISNSLQAMGASSAEAALQMDRIFDVAQRTRAPMDATAQLYTRLSVAAGELGASQEQVFGFTETVGMALAASGTSAQEASGALLQLSQAMAGGTVRAEEFNSILEGAYPIALAAARGIEEAGGSVGKLRQLVNEGEISSKEFFDAILSQSGAIEQSFSETSTTVGQAMTQLRNSTTNLVGTLDGESGLSGALARTITRVSEMVDAMSEWESLSARFPELTAAMTDAMGVAGDVASAQTSAIGAAFSALLEGLNTGIAAVTSVLGGEWSLGWEGAKSAIVSFAEFAMNANPLRPLIDKITSEIREGVASIGQGISEWWTGAILPELTAWSERAIAQGQRLVDGINNGIEAASASVSAALESIWATIKSTVAGWAGGLVQSGRDMIDGYVQGIREKAGAVASAIAGVIGIGPKTTQDVQESNSPSKVYMRLGEDAMQGYANGIEGMSGTVSGAVAEVVNSASEEAAKAAKKYASVGSSVFDSLFSNLSDGGGFRGFWDDVKRIGVNSFSDILKTSFAPGGEGIKGVMSGLSGAFQGVMGAFSAGGGGIIGAVGAAMPLLGAAVGIFNLIKGFYKSETIGSGIQGSISGNSKAMDFEKVKKSIFWGLFSWTKTSKTKNNPLTEYLSDESAMIRRNIGDMVKSIGGSTRGMSGVKQSFKFDTRGMSAKEIREELQVQLQAYSEKVAKKVLRTAKYIRDGEAATEALQRMAQALPTVNAGLELLDKRLFGISLYGANGASALAELMGGLDGFAQSANFVFRNFYSASEQAELVTAQLTRQMKELGFALPTTRDEFRKLMAAQNLNTEAGRETYASLLKIAPAFAEITAASEKLAASLEQSKFATKAAFEFTAAQLQQGNYSQGMVDRGKEKVLLNDILTAIKTGNMNIAVNTAETARAINRQNQGQDIVAA